MFHFKNALFFAVIWSFLLTPWHTVTLLMIVIITDTIWNNENNPDVNFCNVFTHETQYLAPDKFQRNFNPFSKQSLSTLHLNIWSINKNFEAFKQFYLSLNFNLSIVCFSETWANDININKNSSFQLLNYNTKHHIRNQG